MKDCRTLEFFEGDNGRLSMTRLCTFLCFWPCCWIGVRINTVEAIWAIGSIFVLGYVAGRGADAIQSFSNQKPEKSMEQTVTVTKTAKAKS